MASLGRDNVLSVTRHGSSAMELDPRSSSQLCLCSDQQSNDAQGTFTPSFLDMATVAGLAGLKHTVYIKAGARSCTTRLDISPHPPPPAQNEPPNLATRPHNNHRTAKDTEPSSCSAVCPFSFPCPVLGCYCASEAGEAVSILRSRYSRSVRSHIRTTSQEAIMGRGKMDEAAAARIRKARGEKVR